MVRDAHGVRVAIANIAELGRGANSLFEQASGGHADERETSVMLAPEAIRMEPATPASPANAKGRAS